MAGKKDIHIFKVLCLKLVARQNTSLVWACILMAECLLSMQKVLDSMSRIRKRMTERLLFIICHVIANYLSMVSVMLSQNVSRIQQDKTSSHFPSPSGSGIILATSFIYTPGWKIKTQAKWNQSPQLKSFKSLVFYNISDHMKELSLDSLTVLPPGWLQATYLAWPLQAWGLLPGPGCPMPPAPSSAEAAPLSSCRRGCAFAHHWAQPEAPGRCTCHAGSAAACCWRGCTREHSQSELQGQVDFPIQADAWVKLLFWVLTLGPLQVSFPYIASLLGQQYRTKQR